MALHLSEPADSTYRWTLQIQASLSERKVLLGTIRTRPPLDPSGALTTGTPNRCVALAYCPGAVGWEVLVSRTEQTDPREGAPPITDAIGDLIVTSAECCGALTRPGVQAVDADTVGDSVDVIASATFTIGAVATQLLSANVYRKRLVISRGATAAGDPAGSQVTIGRTSGNLGSGGFAMYPGGPNLVTTWTGTLWAIADGANRTLSIWEESQ